MVRMIAGKLRRYGTRMLQAGDEFEVDTDRQRRLLVGARLATEVNRATPAVEDEPIDVLSNLRAEYSEKLGKRPYHGWDEATLREKIADAKDEA